MRSYAREVAFCKIYAFIVSGNIDDDFSQFETDKLTDEDKSFVDKLVRGVAERKSELDAAVSRFSKDF